MTAIKTIFDVINFICPRDKIKIYTKPNGDTQFRSTTYMKFVDNNIKFVDNTDDVIEYKKPRNLKEGDILTIDDEVWVVGKSL